MIAYEWTVGNRTGAGVTDSAVIVAEAVTRALYRHLANEPAERAAHVLYSAWGPLRSALVTDGTSATAQKNGAWEGTAAMISVRIWAL